MSRNGTYTTRLLVTGGIHMPNRRKFSVTIALLTLSFNSVFSAGLSRVALQEPARKRLAIVPAYRRCFPVEVKTVSMGGQPSGVLSAQVSIENRSSKTLTGVKLGWKAYKFSEGRKLALSLCNEPQTTAEVLTSGTTSFVQVGALAPGETCDVGTNPLKIRGMATKTVFVEEPFLKIGDIESLTEDGTMKTLKDDFIIVMFVAEVHYEDGTAWTAESS
jgi:hypothetical protein